jgi:hypothetical protein
MGSNHLYPAVWSAAATRDLMQMASEQKNTREMAVFLSKEYGFRCTRNMVIGKARRENIKLLSNRMGSIGRPKPNGKRKSAKDDDGKVVRLRLPPTFRESSAPMPVPPLLITYADLQSHHCREIIDTAKALSCGHDKQAGSSFCPHHHSINWTAPQPATRRQFVFGGKAA